MAGAKEPVRLRRRLMASGNTSLYLDIYLDGRRSYEYLKLYLIPERTRADKETNRETLRLAAAIQAKRLVEVRNGEFGFKNKADDDVPFYDYFRELIDEKKTSETKSTVSSWKMTLRHLLAYDGREGLTLRNITKEWVVGFKNHLGKSTLLRCKDGARRLSANSKAFYFSKLRACLKRAYEDGLITSDPMRGVPNMPSEETERSYLTIEELKTLARTPCEREEVKSAFLFGCLTGLRHCDIVRLTWGEVSEQDGFTRLTFRQKKTGGQEYLDITGEARKLMGEREADGEHPFKGMGAQQTYNRIVGEWARRAGINKKITFHCSRHTFATMMLNLGTDIYTVSKLLGHREVQTTQIYARIVDKTKQAAIYAIPSILNSGEDKGKKKADTP